MAKGSESMFRNIPLKKIDTNPEQPREHFTGIEELAESIKDEGLLEPIMVRPSKAGSERFEIVHGERRYRACKLTGLTEIPALVRDVDDKSMFRLSVVENVLRNNLTPMEEAHSYARLQGEGHTQKQIGRIIGKGQSYVAHKLRLLKQPELLTYFLKVNAVSENHFRQVMRLKNIVGEEVQDAWVHHGGALGGERDFRSTAIALILIRPMGRASTALPMKPKSRDEGKRLDIVREAVKRFDGYVAKHTETPTWHRTALWFLCAIVGHDWTVAETQRAIDNYEDLIKSALSWHCYRMEDKQPKYWDEYDWAVFHDLKHAGLLGVATDDVARKADSLGWVSRRGGYAVPSDLQGREPFWEDEGWKEKLTEDKTLEELEYGLSRSTDRMWGYAVMQAEALRVMYHHPDGWKKRGYKSFGEYVEAEAGRPEEAVVREDGGLRPQRELAATLDEWGGDTALADVLFDASRRMGPEDFLELLKPMDDEDWGIPQEAVMTADGTLYPKTVMARNLHTIRQED